MTASDADPLADQPSLPQLVLASLALPALLGFALTGTLRGALTGLL